MAAEKKKDESDLLIISRNRRATHEYHLVETLECGIVLTGTEVKSLRENAGNLDDAYAKIENGEVWLLGMHIQPYANATSFGAHDPDRRRKLLLHKREIANMEQAVKEKSLVLVPLTMRFNDDGRVKLDIAIARGKKTYDKRHAIAARDSARDEERETRRRR